MTSANDIYEDLIFYSTDDKFFVESLQSQKILIIDRISAEIILESNKGQIPFTASQKTIFGIIGIINLIAGPYIIIITKRARIGLINNQPIWRIVEVEVVPFSRSFALNNEQKFYNEKYLSLVNQVLSTPYFYFSYSYDLTHTLQRLYYTSEDFLQIPMHERADVRFLWNHHLLRNLANQPELSRFCLPIVHGFVSIRQCSLNGQWFTYILISRRSVYRAGTRMWVRGIDREGCVANYVETEQIIEFKDHRSSFVQTRGSIPLFWSQEPDLTYKPAPNLQNGRQAEAFTRHCEAEIMTYNKIIMVNLIDHKGKEAELQETFKSNIYNSENELIRDNIIYEYFDFHHECRKMRWDRLSILIDRLSPHQQNMEYFLLRSGVILADQGGVFRTNCIDCLDRTNVVQSLLARVNLFEVLSRIGILKFGQKIEDHISFDFMLKNIWADNADAISVQYSGTGALKTDFTRTGRRTRVGLLKDGLNSGIRYVKNNFFDGDRQDSIDLFLGKYQVQVGECITTSCPLKPDTEDNWLLMFPFLFFICLLMVFASILLSSEYTTFTLFSILFWISMSAVALLTTFSHGRQLVNRPKLCDTTFSTLVTSKGFI